MRPWTLQSIAFILSFLSVTSFVTKFSTFHRKKGLSTRQSSTKRCATIDSTLEDRAARFHTDMLRVLESREHMKENLSISHSPLERRRPTVLDSDIDGVERVATMLERMVEIGVATEKSYQIVLKGLADRGRLRWRRDYDTIVCAADEVGPLLDRLWDSMGEISSETCNLALKAYATCSTPRGDRCYADNAQTILERMKESGMTISVETYSHMVHAFAWQQENKKPGRCAKIAQEYFDEMLQLSPDSSTVMQGYHWLLEAWSKSSSRDSTDRAEKIFHKMLEMKDNKEGRLSAQAYSNIILSWTKKRGIDSAEKANRWLLQMVEDYENGGFVDNTEPELIPFNGVISTWCKLHNMDKAEEVLWLADNIRTKCETLSPDVVTFNTVLHGYLFDKNKSKALDRILAIVAYLEENAQERPELKPNEFTYNTVLKAWVQSGRQDYIVRAEETLQKMQDVWDLKPSSRHYNVVINALAKSRYPDARKAYNYFLQMQASETCNPDIISYTTVLECFSKSKDPEAAEIGMNLLEEAINIYDETGNLDMKPNMRTYTMAIRTLSTNSIPKNILKARDLLTRLVDQYEETNDPDLCPNAFPYNYVLDCAANCIGSEKEKLKAFQIAAKTYNDVRHSKIIDADSFTYAFWIKCCNNLLPDGELRTKGVTYAFEQCRNDGLVSSETLKRMLAGTPPKVVSSLLDIKPGTSPTVYRKLSLDDIPPSWSRNIK